MKNRTAHPLPDFSHIPAEGLKIVGMEAISGIKGFGSIQFARNRYDPYLMLYTDHLAMNVMHTKDKPYREIERMILMPRRKPYAMRLYFKQDYRTFSMTILDRELLMAVYEFIQVKRKEPAG